MNYKKKPFVKPRQVRKTTEEQRKTTEEDNRGNQQSNERHVDEDERQVEKTVEEKTVTPRKYKGWVYIPETEAEETMAQESEDDNSVRVLQDTVEAENEDTEKAVNEDDEETQLNIAEIYVPSSDEDNVPIVQTIRAQVCPPHKRIPKDKYAVGQLVAKRFDAGLFQGKVASIDKRRGRCLYHIIYEDGDSEDMDEMEYEDAWFLYIKTQNEEGNYPRREDTGSEMMCSDLEGSVHQNSEKEVTSKDEDRPHNPSPSPRSKGHKRKRKAHKVSDIFSHYFMYSA